MDPGMQIGTTSSDFFPFRQREGQGLLVEGHQFPLNLIFQPFSGDKGIKHTLFCKRFSAEIEMLLLSGPRKVGMLIKDQEGSVYI